MYVKCILAIFILFVTGICVNAKECYNSSIITPSPFMGNNGEIFKLSDSSLWEVQHSYEYMYEYYPDVIVCPTIGKLLVKGKTISIKLVSAGKSSSDSKSKSKENRPEQLRKSEKADLIESQISGEFTGWEGETIFKLTNGQIWQQAAYAYTYSYKYMPKVMIFPSRGGYEMQVEGIDNRIRVVRIK